MSKAATQIDFKGFKDGTAAANVFSMIQLHSREKQVIATALGCAHCGKETANRFSRFCCAGCETVYGLLHDQGLGNYYALRDRYGKAIPKKNGEREESYSYLDDPEFIKVYAEANGTRMRFYLEGVHCAACVWLTERLPTLSEGVKRADLNLGNGVATVEIVPGGSFAKAAEAFSRIGYLPHPVELQKAEEANARSNRTMLLRLGVAAACSGNIMLFAIAIYAGAGVEYSRLFQWLSFGLYIPVLFFSAAPFFLNAFRSLKNQKLSIDVPISFGILSGSIVSVVHLFRKPTEIYFDSLSGLIFLLLASRYFLSRVQAKSADASQLLHFLTPSRSRKIVSDGSTRPVRSDSLVLGDQVEVLVGEIIPVDGVVYSGRSELSRSWMTGETQSQAVEVGDFVFAGSLNESGALVIEVRASGLETRLGEILRRTEMTIKNRSPLISFSDRVAHLFVPVTFLLIGIGFVIGMQISISEAISRAIAVAIVVCPCALAMAIPLVMSLSIGRLAKKGILIRGADVLERLSRVETVIFDKTGTLTTGVLQVSSWCPSRPGVEKILLALEKNSIHPVAKAIRKYFESEKMSLPEVIDLKEVIGIGVSGKIGEHLYTVRRSDLIKSGTEVSLYEDENLIGNLIFSEVLRNESSPTVERLKEMGVYVGLLSGDNHSAVKRVSRNLSLSSSLVHAGCSPEKKAELVRSNPFTLMVGDGANDAPALASAWLGMAVQGGMEVSMRAAGIYGSTANLLDVPRLIGIARESMRVIRRNLFFTLFYNFTVVGIALSGFLKPVVAAVLMPASAFTVFGLSILGTVRLRQLFQEVGK